MANKPNVGILMKVVILLLIVVLYFSITIPAEMRQLEVQAKELSRERMSILSEAVKFYALRKTTYTSNFEDILSLVSSDSSLNERKQIVQLTQNLSEKLEGILKVQSADYLKTIKITQVELYNVLDEINDTFQDNPEIKQQNLTALELVKDFAQLDTRPNFINAMEAVDSIRSLTVDIQEYTLQISANKGLHHAEILVKHFDKIELASVKEIWTKIKENLMTLKALLSNPNFKQNFTDRYLRHIEIIDKQLLGLETLNGQEELNHLQNKFSAIQETNDDFVRNYFSLTQRFGKKGLDKEEALIVKLDENTIYAPPVKVGERELKFNIELTQNGFGYKISCPNDKGALAYYGIFAMNYMNYGTIENGIKDWEK